ncbi:MAG: cobalt transporter CbiM [Deferribacteres bacterium]|nr:cobalt transporter CbiM [Deferribacteres bacterium]
MHISEGVLPVTTLALGWGATACGLYIGFRKLDYHRMPFVAFLSAVFFIGSFVHVPLGPTSVHLVLNGIVGMLLGWASFPAMFVALFIQALLFQFGGLLVLGVNTLNMAAPAVVVHYLFRDWLRSGDGVKFVLASVLGASGAVLMSAVMVGLELMSCGGEFRNAALLVFAAHIPVAVVEAVVAFFVFSFLRKSRPEVLKEL